MSSENTQEVNAQCPKCFALCNEKDVDYDSKQCKGCKPKTPADRLAEELEKFENGPQRYDSHASFTTALNSLAHGLGVYAVLDSALKRIELLHEANRVLAKRIELTEHTYTTTRFLLEERTKENVQLIEKLKKYEPI